MFRVPAKVEVGPVGSRDFVIFTKQGSLLPTLIPDDVADPEGSDGGRGGVAAALRFFGRTSKMECWRWSGVLSRGRFFGSAAALVLVAGLAGVGVSGFAPIVWRGAVRKGLGEV